MIFSQQQSALEELRIAANSNIHSILLVGPEGCGKSILAKEYGKLLNISDTVTVLPTVSDIRSAMETCMRLGSPIVLCIENLDVGVSASSATTLKFLEEPPSYVYIVVTCRNINKIPETIPSRCCTIDVGAPTSSDLLQYITSKSSNIVLDNDLVKSLRSFSDIDNYLELTAVQRAYIESLNFEELCKRPVSDIVWKLGHFQDNSVIPIQLILSYLIYIAPTQTIQRAGISCASDISRGAIASHAALAKFAFTMKYVE